MQLRSHRLARMLVDTGWHTRSSTCRCSANLLDAPNLRLVHKQFRTRMLNMYKNTPAMKKAKERESQAHPEACVLSNLSPSY
eukprot:36187-Chlamydomonas_euryale.AAC.2